jgi:hypothetical protein
MMHCNYIFKITLNGGDAMKKCNTCNKEYDESRSFCPMCGRNLVPVITTQVQTSWIENWGGFLAALVGLFIAWVISAFAGLVISILGILWGVTSQNKLNKVLSIAVGAVTILLYIIYI